MDLFKRLSFCLLVCLLVGKVIAENPDTGTKDNLTDFMPAQSSFFLK
jgi:hypothetical protein